MNALEEKPKKSGKPIIITALGFLLFLAIAGFVYWFFFMRTVVSTDDARMEADLVNLAPQVSGVLADIRVIEGGRVQKGQVVYTLKKVFYEAALRHAEAARDAALKNMVAAEAVYDKAVHGPLPQEIMIAEAEKARLEAAMELASLEWNRTRDLYEKNAVTESERDSAGAARKSAQEALNEAVNRLSLLKAGTRKEDLRAALALLEMNKALLKQSEAALEQARINLNNTEVYSPYDGFMVKRWIDPGTYLQAGTPVLSIINPSSLHVAANITEKNLYRIAVGDRADFSIDSFPGKKFTGRVESIMRVVNSRFSLIPAEGVSGTYIKLTQRIPIRVKFDIPPGMNLGPGLSVVIHIHTNTHAGTIPERP
jgi:membrane fusion protein, multidrug efflux system